MKLDGNQATLLKEHEAENQELKSKVARLEAQLDSLMRNSSEEREARAKRAAVAGKGSFTDDEESEYGSESSFDWGTTTPAKTKTPPPQRPLKKPTRRSETAPDLVEVRRQLNFSPEPLVEERRDKDRHAAEELDTETTKEQLSMETVGRGPASDDEHDPSFMETDERADTTEITFTGQLSMEHPTEECTAQDD
ncbi:hypothetical protein AAVH_23649, partial [Aphelenchoides avenae]